MHVYRICIRHKFIFDTKVIRYTHVLTTKQSNTLTVRPADHLPLKKKWRQRSKCLFIHSCAHFIEQMEESRMCSRNTTHHTTPHHIGHHPYMVIHSGTVNVLNVPIGVGLSPVSYRYDSLFISFARTIRSSCMWYEHVWRCCMQAILTNNISTIKSSASFHLF